MLFNCSCAPALQVVYPQRRESFLRAMGTHNRFKVSCRGSSHGAKGRARGTAQSPGLGAAVFALAKQQRFSLLILEDFHVLPFSPQVGTGAY